MTEPRQLSEAELQEILKLPEHLQGTGFIETSMRKTKIKDLHGYVKKIHNREERLCGFVSLDEERRNSEGDVIPSPHELIASIDPAEIVAYLQVTFDEATEATLKAAALPAKELGKLAKCCLRTAKSKRKNLAEEYAGKTEQMPLFPAQIVGGEE